MFAADKSVTTTRDTSRFDAICLSPINQLPQHETRLDSTLLHLLPINQLPQQRPSRFDTSILADKSVTTTRDTSRFDTSMFVADKSVTTTRDTSRFNTSVFVADKSVTTTRDV